ncbi:MAG: T9SS type A sorting domain-containing protein [Bacteroidetes bacterium]|nr:T9SS type A sorting domain-containing protein [Bacteroidota bacterium]
MKKILIIIIFLVPVTQLFSQTLFSNSFGNLGLQTYTTATSSVQYTTTPSIFSIINDGHNNNVGSATNPNKPFNVPSFKTQGWAVLYNALENDTFLVSTSWLDTLLAVDRWVITPPISNITANTVITWLAKSPDPNYQESYLLYGTNKTGTLTPLDFAIGDQLYSTSAENSTWTRHSVNLGVAVGQTLRFAFRNNSLNKYQVWIDDIEVLTLPTSVDAALGSIETSKYILANSNDTVKVNLSNLGATTINTVTLNYTIGNSSINSQVFSFANGLAYKQNNLSVFPLPFSVSTAGNYKLKVWLSANSINNTSVDQNQLNDTVFTYITVQNTAPRKSVLVEQFVSAFDGDCTDALQKILALQNDSVVVVNVHDLDSLKEPNSIGIISAYKKNTATAMFDRNYFSTPGSVAVTRPYYANMLAKQLRKVSPASVSIINKTYNSTTKQLSFTVKADFVGEVIGDLRLNAYLVENQVHGAWGDTTVNGYNQLNNYYNVPWSPFYQMGYYSFTYSKHVLNGFQFPHQNTLVYSFDGSFGNAGIIPTTGGTQNQSYQKTYTLTIPTPTNNINKFNSDNLYIVGFLAEYSANQNNRNVLNVIKEKLSANNETLGLKETTTNSFLSVFPNPSNGMLYLKSSKTINTYEIKVIDLMGRSILIQNLHQVGNMEMLDISNLNNGIYFLHISSESGNFVEKIVIQKN